MPRPTKLTPETQARIIQALEAGNYFETACGYAGIGKTTAYRWLEQGEQQSSGIYRDFRDAVEKASSNAEARNVALIQQAAKDTWQAAAWWLERRAPDRWGRQRQEITGANGGDIVIKVVRGNQDTSE
jgi:transposase